MSVWITETFYFKNEELRRHNKITKAKSFTKAIAEEQVLSLHGMCLLPKDTAATRSSALPALE